METGCTHFCDEEAPIKGSLRVVFDHQVDRIQRFLLCSHPCQRSKHDSVFELQIPDRPWGEEGAGGFGSGNGGCHGKR